MNQDENWMKVLSLLNTGIDDRYNALEKLQKEPIQRGMREQGQSTKDFFLNPNQGQSRAMMEFAGGILNRDRSKPGMAGINEGYRRGLDLMEEMRTRDKNQQIQAETVGLSKESDKFRRMVEMMKAAPKPVKQNVDQKFYWNPETRHRIALQENNGILSQKDGAVVHPESLAERGYIPLTASAAQINTSDLKPPTPTDSHKLLNMEKAHQAYIDFEDLLSGDWTSDAQAIVQGRIGLPTDVGRRWKENERVVRNVIGRMESGGQIRKDEQSDYVAMLVPTVLDLGSPDVIERKIRTGKASAEIFGRLATGEITSQEAISELRAVYTADPAGNTHEGEEILTPGGRKVTVR